MQIANPIYDVVFKFLLEDTDSAILLLSAIIGEPIETLDFLPQENIAHVEPRSLTVYRLDFSAKIKTAEGYKQVLIEIQKAKLASDIMRFRRYLGEQYSNKNNVYAVEDGTLPLPIITIYFLGYPLEHIDTPVVKVNRDYYDVVNRRSIDAKDVFIESLTHDSYVIQISRLRAQHQSEIEQLLAIFDQHKLLLSDQHMLEFDEQSYPDKYRPLIRRLQRAVLDSDIRNTMDIEDEILADLQDLERKIERKEQEIERIEQEVKQKEQENLALLSTLEEKDKLIAQLQKQLSEGQ